ncbi:MAG: hypothetical protein NT118_11875, partial [Lentisphaerae bacterium]|nr:hypothetical protein [Lentisphaerota bacterium]
MNPEQAQKALVEKVAVTNQMVTYAKAYFIEHYNSETRALINSLLDNIDAKKPVSVVIHQSVVTAATISQAAKAISWRLAGCEAIWGLIANNILIPGSI